MAKFDRGQYIIAIKDISLRNGDIIQKGARGKIIGVSTDGLTISVQFDDYMGGVGVWLDWIAPADTPPQADADETVGLDTLEHAKVLIQAMNKEHATVQAENAALQQRVKALEAALETAQQKAGLWPSAMSDIEELAWDNQGEWAAVTDTYAPEWTHGYKRILEEIERVKVEREQAAQDAQGQGE